MSMNSKSQICSLASVKYLGAGQVIDVDTDKTILARAMAVVYDNVRDSLLREYIWAFATKRLVIPQTTSPAFGWSSAHVLPLDCMRLNRIDNYGGTYEIENNLVLSNHVGAMDIVYISNLADITKYTPLFVSLLAAELADAVGIEVRGDGFKASREEKLVTDLKDLRKKAKLVDAQEQRKKQRLLFGEYENYRRGGRVRNTTDYIDV